MCVFCFWVGGGTGRKNIKTVLVLRDMSQGLVCGPAVKSVDWSWVHGLPLALPPTCSLCALGQVL